jgi:hypothetical protein
MEIAMSQRYLSPSRVDQQGRRKERKQKGDKENCGVKHGH